MTKLRYSGKDGMEVSNDITQDEHEVYLKLHHGFAL
jgi:hypothetical protein